MMNELDQVLREVLVSNEFIAFQITSMLGALVVFHVIKMIVVMLIDVVFDSAIWLLKRVKRVTKKRLA